MVVVDKEQKAAVMIGVTIPADSHIRKEYEKTVKYQGLREQLEQMRKVKSKVVPGGIR